MSIDLLAKLQQSLLANELFYSRQFTNAEINLFCRYYELVLKWNDRLHLTTVTAPSEFAERHILESAFTLQHLLSSIDQIWDIGSGVGIPGVPLAILRPNLTVHLIEANPKKAIFLKELKFELGISNLQIINQRFEGMQGIRGNSCITTRALDDLSRLIPEILKLGQAGSQFLFLGNNQLLETLRLHIQPNSKLSSFKIPNSNNRQAISLTRFT